MSYIDVVNVGHNAQTQDKCRDREATEVSTSGKFQCVCGGGVVM